MRDMLPDDRLERSQVLDRVRSSKKVSVLIVGAGINGAATFLDLAHQGIDVLLIDKGDVASGASSALSRMVHGGLRYLENAELSLVAESTLERNLLLRNAHHLVKPLKIIVPYSSRMGGFIGAIQKLLRLDSAPAGRGGWLIKCGLAIYDFLGRHHRTLPRYKSLTRSELRTAIRGISHNAVGAARYYDAWIPHPERLNLELVTDGLELQPRSNALFYARLDRLEEGEAVIVDLLTKEEISIKPDILVNATGAWIDFTNKAAGVDGRLIGGTKGSHLVLKNPALREALGDSMLWFEAKDGRTCIVFPFLGNVLLGSTDIRIEDPEDALCVDDEIDYMFGVLKEVLPHVELSRSDIIYKFSGVRPLPSSTSSVTARISRNHSIQISEPVDKRQFPILSLVGGKWTTFRSFGQDATDVVLRKLGLSRRQSTKDVPIGGSRGMSAKADDKKMMMSDLAARFNLQPSLIETWLERYGSSAEQLAATCSKSLHPDRPLLSNKDYTVGEMQWICRTQLVTHLDDIILRRTLIALRGEVTPALIEEVSEIAAECLGWTEDSRKQEVADCYAKLVRQHGVPKITKRSRNGVDVALSHANE